MGPRSFVRASVLAFAAGLLCASGPLCAQGREVRSAAALERSFRAQLALARDASRSLGARAEALRVVWRAEFATPSTLDEVAPLLADPSPELRLAAVSALGEAARMLTDPCSPGVDDEARARASAMLQARLRDERDDRVLVALYALSTWRGAPLLVASPRERRRALVVGELEGNRLTAQLLALAHPYSRIEAVEVHATDLEVHSNQRPSDVRCDTVDPDETPRGRVARFSVTVRCPTYADALPWLLRATVRVRLRGGGRFAETLFFARARASSPAASSGGSLTLGTSGGRVRERR